MIESPLGILDVVFVATEQDNPTCCSADGGAMGSLAVESCRAIAEGCRCNGDG